MAMLRRWTPASVGLLLSFSGDTFCPGRLETLPRETTAHRPQGAPGSTPQGASKRMADRVIARRVRGAIRADPFLALATQTVKVTSYRGVVRLIGRVRTDKE